MFESLIFGLAENMHLDSRLVADKYCNPAMSPNRRPFMYVTLTSSEKGRGEEWVCLANGQERHTMAGGSKSKVSVHVTVLQMDNNKSVS